MIHVAKIFIIVIVSFLLLYYGIAWAVLRCSHDAEHSDHAVAVEDVDATHKDLHDAALNPVHLDLECVGPDFHTEAMAEASLPPQLDRLTPANTPHVNDFLMLGNVPGDAATDFWLRAVFEGSRSLAFLMGLPSYLFLSILRI